MGVGRGTGGDQKRGIRVGGRMEGRGVKCVCVCRRGLYHKGNYGGVGWLGWEGGMEDGRGGAGERSRGGWVESRKVLSNY